MSAPPIPDTRRGIIPYLAVNGAADAIDLYTKAFGAVELYRLAMPDGGIGHAELQLGESVIYLADAPDDMPGGFANPAKLGGTSVMIHRYVTDCDASYEQAVDAGCDGLRPPEDQFYGDRAAVVVDPWGHMWSLHTHVRDVSPEEMEAAIGQMGQ